MHFVIHFTYTTLDDRAMQLERESASDTAKPLRDIMENLAHELGRGVGLLQDFILLIGRKPLS